MPKEFISLNHYTNSVAPIELIAGEVLNVTDVKKSVLVVLEVDFGNGDVRNVITNLKKDLGDGTHEYFKGKRFLFITNLEPVTIKGVESRGMIFCSKTPNSEGLILPVEVQLEVGAVVL